MDGGEMMLLKPEKWRRLRLLDLMLKVVGVDIVEWQSKLMVNKLIDGG